MYYADLAGLKGKARQWFGWLLIICSDLAFGAVTIYEMRRLITPEATQQPLINTTTLLGDIGIIVVLLVLAILMVWRLTDLFKKKGRWVVESTQSIVDNEEVRK